MMEREILVHADLRGRSLLVGRLWSRSRKGREGAAFEYDKTWLVHPDRFSIEPALTLGPGPFHAPQGKPLFGAIGDSAPDRWGQALMRRAERRRAQGRSETPRTLLEIDYLLGVSDEARLGALRFAESQGGPFLAKGGPDRIPPLIELPRLLSAADRVSADKDTDEDLRLLLAPGSSLGGARPKASVRGRDGELAIAKFPNKQDEFGIVSWEAVALTLAAKAGIAVPSWRIETVAKRPVLLLERFDRQKEIRIPFLSALSMLEAKEEETRSYLEFVDALRRYGAAPKEDMHALWRRIVFNVMITNTDDHLRNHGFLWEGRAGWRLAPAYDLNPVPTEIRPRVLTTAIDREDRAASLKTALDVAEYFELSAKQARATAHEVAQAVRLWKVVARKLGIAAAEIDRMSSAFDHEDLEQALAFR